MHFHECELTFNMRRGQRKIPIWKILVFLGDVVEKEVEEDAGTTIQCFPKSSQLSFILLDSVFVEQGLAGAGCRK